MRNFIIIIITCVVLVGAGYAAKQMMRPDFPDIITPRINEVVDNFAFESINGKPYTLYDFKGQPIIVHFWATWCAPCVVEFPELATYGRDNPDVIILAISADINEDKMKRFLQQNVPDIPKNMIIARDITDSKIQHQFGTYQLPETYILSNQMILKEKIIGAYKDWRSFQFLP